MVGKTTTLQSLVCSAALTHTPEAVQFYVLALGSPALGSLAELTARRVSGLRP